MKEQIQEILEEARRSIPSCESDKNLEELRIKYLGKKSSLSGLLSKIGTIPKEKRPQMGAFLNIVKKEIAQLIEQKKLELHEKADALKTLGLDVTFLTIFSKASGLFIASSDNIFRLISIFNSLRPFMNWL